jgi:hypothetical protein
MSSARIADQEFVDDQRSTRFERGMRLANEHACRRMSMRVVGGSRSCRIIPITGTSARDRSSTRKSPGVEPC